MNASLPKGIKIEQHKSTALTIQRSRATMQKSAYYCRRMQTRADECKPSHEAKQTPVIPRKTHIFAKEFDETRSDSGHGAHSRPTSGEGPM